MYRRLTKIRKIKRIPLWCMRRYRRVFSALIRRFIRIAFVYHGICGAARAFWIYLLCGSDHTEKLKQKTKEKIRAVPAGHRSSILTQRETIELLCPVCFSDHIRDRSIISKTASI